MGSWCVWGGGTKVNPFQKIREFKFDIFIALTLDLSIFIYTISYGKALSPLQLLRYYAPCLSSSLFCFPEKVHVVVHISSLSYPTLPLEHKRIHRHCT